MAKIDFILENLPTRTYDKSRESNLYKILSAIAEELDIFLDEMEEVKNSSFVDTSKGKNLDKIAAILNLERIIGESDSALRARIKSRIPSFIGGGNISAIKQVIENYLGITPNIIEHYKPGEGHIRFDNGVLKGLNVELIDQKIKISSGVFYINGTRITSNDLEIDFDIYSSNEINYVFIDSDVNISIRDKDNYNEEFEIPIAYIEDETVYDNRFILNPYEHYITNVATISIQIPYDFESSAIKLEEIEEAVRKSKAAGIAVLLQVAKTNFKDIIRLKDFYSLYFENGFTGIGSMNTIGFGKSTTWEDLGILNTWNNYEGFSLAQLGAGNYYWS